MTTPLSKEKTDVGSYFISNYPPYGVWKRELVGEAVAAVDHAPPRDLPLGLYLHIPFCRKRCKFCYFRVYTDRNSRQVERYVAALSREIEIYSQRPVLTERPFRFAYFGGGTPSYLSSRQLLSLADRLRASVSWDDAEEVTFECEPGTLSEQKLRTIRDIGVTRLSLGIESFDDQILEENGRAHRSAEVFRAYDQARGIGFPQINVDLIAGMVGETEDKWRDSVRKTVALAPDSVTVYQMELPYNAVYAGALQDGAPLDVADWSTKREWVDHAFDELEAAGYHVSSAYTMVRDPSVTFVYRDSLWRGADMLGTGVASISHIGGVHFQNVDGIDAYADALEEGRLPLGRALVPTRRELFLREMILQLKLGRLDPDYFLAKFDVAIREEFEDIWDELRAEGLLERRTDEIRLTRAGLLRVDGLLPRFFAPEYRGTRYT